MYNENALYSHEKRFLDASYDESVPIGRCCECFNKVYSYDEPFVADDKYICDIKCLSDWCLRVAGNTDLIQYANVYDFNWGLISDFKKFAEADKYCFSEWYQQEYKVKRKRYI